MTFLEFLFNFLSTYFIGLNFIYYHEFLFSIILLSIVI